MATDTVRRTVRVEPLSIVESSTLRQDIACLGKDEFGVWSMYGYGVEMNGNKLVFNAHAQVNRSYPITIELLEISGCSGVRVYNGNAIIADTEEETITQNGFTYVVLNESKDKAKFVLTNNIDSSVQSFEIITSPEWSHIHYKISDGTPNDTAMYQAHQCSYKIKLTFGSKEEDLQGRNVLFIEGRSI